MGRLLVDLWNEKVGLRCLGKGGVGQQTAGERLRSLRC